MSKQLNTCMNGEQIPSIHKYLLLLLATYALLNLKRDYLTNNYGTG
jgi:hypothetical protein